MLGQDEAHDLTKLDILKEKLDVHGVRLTLRVAVFFEGRVSAESVVDKLVRSLGGLAGGANQ